MTEKNQYVQGNGSNYYFLLLALFNAKQFRRIAMQKHYA